jgi:hypothetical protein
MPTTTTPRFTSPEFAAVLAETLTEFDREFEQPADADRYTGDEDVVLVRADGYVSVYQDGFHNGTTKDADTLRELIYNAWNLKARGWVG